MNLQMDGRPGEQYNSNSQKIRVITESWAKQNLFCPYCGKLHVEQFDNNKPVGDFYCPFCLEEYELKSKKGCIGDKVGDGAYRTMLERISSFNNPNFFFMHYGRSDLRVKNLIMIPKYFFVPEIIEKRNPLAHTARRAGWTGCNILLKKIPDEGKIYIVKDEKEQKIEDILLKVRKTEFIRKFELEARGWLLDILNCVNEIEGREFTLSQMYQFKNMLSLKYPGNNHVKEKIRQQLQILRNKGIIEFCGQGHYRKLL